MPLTTEYLQKTRRRGREGGRGGEGEKDASRTYIVALVSFQCVNEAFFSNLLVTFTLVSKEKGITIKQKKISK